MMKINLKIKYKSKPRYLHKPFVTCGYHGCQKASAGKWVNCQKRFEKLPKVQSARVKRPTRRFQLDKKPERKNEGHPWEGSPPFFDVKCLTLAKVSVPDRKITNRKEDHKRRRKRKQEEEKESKKEARKQWVEKKGKINHSHRIRRR